MTVKSTTLYLCLSIITAEYRIQVYSRKLTLTIGQTSVLDAAFRNNCFPNKDTLMLLAQQTCLTEGRVCRWFRDKRRRIRYGRKEGANSIGEKEGDDNSITMNIIHMYKSKLICNICTC